MKATAQTALDERVVENAELERALEDREIAKGAAGEARKKFTTLDDLAKGKVNDLNLQDGEAVRIGRFRVAYRKVPAKSVAFETEPSERLTISTPKDEA